MTETLDMLLARERAAYYRRAGGGLSLPVAGLVYWTVFGLLGFVLDTRTWCIAAFIGSGLIFPLGLLLSRPLGANLFAPSPLSGAFGPAMLAMMLTWPITFAAFAITPELVPLCLAIGLGLHWPIIGWMYGRSAAFSAHALVRAGLAIILWFALPEARFTLLPLAVAAVYAASAVFIAIDRGRGDRD